MHSNFHRPIEHNRGLFRLLSRNSERYVQNASRVLYDWASAFCSFSNTQAGKCLMQTVRQDFHQIWNRDRNLSHFKEPFVMKQDGSLLFLSCASGLCLSGTHRSVSQQVGYEPVAAWFKFGNKFQLSLNPHSLYTRSRTGISSLAYVQMFILSCPWELNTWRLVNLHPPGIYSTSRILLWNKAICTAG